jgi:hypothetical protein
MTRTYLVALTDSISNDPLLVADDIMESLVSDGFDVESVKPWAAPVSAPQTTTLFANPLASPTIPPEIL